MISFILKILSFIDKFLAFFEKSLVCLSLGVMLVFASTQVILRNFFHDGIEWADILVRHMVLFILFFGASLSTRDRRHIQMDVSAKIVPKMFKPLVSLLVNAFCIFICYQLYKSAYVFMQGERESASVLFANIPTWYFISVMPLGFGMITFRFGLNIIDNLLVICRVKAAPTEESIGGHALVSKEVAP